MFDTIDMAHESNIEKPMNDIPNHYSSKTRRTILRGSNIPNFDEQNGNGNELDFCINDHAMKLKAMHIINVGDLKECLNHKQCHHCVHISGTY